MKRILSVVFATVMFLTIGISCFASDFINPSIVDEAGYLTEDEYAELSERLEEIRSEYGFDVVIYTETSLSGKDAGDAARFIYDIFEYGNEDGDGLMLYMCSGSRDYYFLAKGAGSEYFNSNGLRYLDEEVVHYFSDDNYYEGFDTFIDRSDELLRMAMEGNPYNVEKVNVKYVAGVIGAAVIIPLVIALVMMFVKLKKMKTAVANDYAANYVKPGSMNLSVSRDLFLFSTITKTKKVNANSSGSSGQKSSGRGGKF